MQNEIDQNEIYENEAKQYLETDNLVFENIVKDLENKGYDDKQTSEILLKIESMLKEKLFQESLNNHKNDEFRKIALLLILIIGAIVAIFNLTSFPTFPILLTICGIIGYLGFVKSRIAGAISSIILVILINYAWTIYFQNRTSFIKIEVIIPIIMAGIPSYIIFIILNSIIRKFK